MSYIDPLGKYGRNTVWEFDYNPTGTRPFIEGRLRSIGGGLMPVAGEWTGVLVNGFGIWKVVRGIISTQSDPTSGETAGERLEPIPMPITPVEILYKCEE